MSRCIALASTLLALCGLLHPTQAASPKEVAGIYPHLALYNQHGECGTGAVVPWAGRLWVITYGPHFPKGSTDRLYSIDSALTLTAHPESVGGTPANRMIHSESQQLLIGPYVINAQGGVRVIPPTLMYGRLTGNARHLTDPAHKVYYATMEEGFYEVDMATLAVTELFRDEQLKEPARRAYLPGYHGKGLYSGQGLLIYANNGENSPLARQRPDIPSGALATWDGTASGWNVVQRNQFTEVTGPGGLTGNADPARDPVWSIGWDHRSLLLLVLDQGRWHRYRLPKASHSYDGAHGWNTEWPRIRDIGETDLLMTMHGTFWRFPRTFTAGHSAGLAPRSTYLKVVGDFARWGDRVVLGCDDTAQSEFLNKRRAKGNLAAPGQSHSNLWFIDPARLDHLGAPLGRGAVWQEEPVQRDLPSDPYLFSGYELRGLHLVHDAGEPVTFTIEVDRAGNNTWSELRRVEVPAAGYLWTEFAAAEPGAWIRLRASRDCQRVTAQFSYRSPRAEPRGPTPDFAGLLTPGAKTGVGGLLHARGEGRGTLQVAAVAAGAPGSAPAAHYEMGADLVLRPTGDAAALAWMQTHVAIPSQAITLDAASALYVDEQGRRFRLPKSRADASSDGPFGPSRVVREVCTERDLLNCAGSFFELPAENAGGIAKVRPVATHHRMIHDYASWRGFLVLTGLDLQQAGASSRVVRSEDGRAAVWLGTVDDLWDLGRPVGVGGPWKDTEVRAGVASDAYLFTGYSNRSLSLSHASADPVRMTVEVDLTGTGHWVEYRTFEVPAKGSVDHAFPAAFQAYWLRVTAQRDTRATAWLTYQ
jgi:hypothetical protein